MCFFKPKIALLVLVCLSLMLFSAAFVSAEPISVAQEREEAQKVKQQLQEIDGQLDVTVEKYNQANYNLAKTKENIRITEETQKKTAIRLVKQNKLLNHRIISIYKNGNVGFTSTLTGTRNFNNFLTRLSYLIQIGNQDIDLLKEIKKTKTDLMDAKLRLKKEETEQNLLRDKLRQERQSIENKVADRTAYLNTVEGNIQKIIIEEEQKEARAQAQEIQKAQQDAGQHPNPAQNNPPAQNQPASKPNNPPNSQPGNQPNDKEKDNNKPAEPAPPAPPKSGPHSEVVGIAMQHLGKPYQWGAAGPDSFDCSGLVMYCYAQIGISLPHSAAAQYNRGTKIGREYLAPGDLVFFGKTGISHVGIFAGGGRYIHAPRTGDVIKVSSISSRNDYFGACRP